MLQFVRNVLARLSGARVVGGTGTRPSSALDDGLPNGDAFIHALNVASLGEEGAADLERRLADYRRESAYRKRVERQERLLVLRRRELANQREFESLS